MRFSNLLLPLPLPSLVHLTILLEWFPSYNYHIFNYYNLKYLRTLSDGLQRELLPVLKEER